MKKVVLAVGQFVPRKGYDILLQAWKQCDQNNELWIIGGDAPSAYIELKNKLRLSNVYFIGFKCKEELMEYYKAADLFVHPTREDIWGLVINEALANGLPVVTTDRCVGGCELVQNGINGYIVPTGDSEKLSNAITKILEDDILRQKMSENSIKKIRNWTIEEMARRHYAVLEEYDEK
ncbi:glycosyltransferase family 4 protein [Bacillota bacterium HCP3S3_F1_1]